MRRLSPALVRRLAFSLAGRVLAGSEPGSKARQAEVTRAALMEINPTQWPHQRWLSKQSSPSAVQKILLSVKLMLLLQRWCHGSPAETSVKILRR